MNTKQSTGSNGNENFWNLIADEAVDRAMDTVIPQAENLIRDLFKYRHHRMERNQFTNLLATSLETESVVVVLDFIRYQMGRDRGGNTWRTGNPSFGAQLLKQLEDLKTTAHGLVDTSIQKYGIEPMDRAGEVNRLWLLLVRKYAGSLHRNFVYFKVMPKEGTRS